MWGKFSKNNHDIFWNNRDLRITQAARNVRSNEYLVVVVTNTSPKKAASNKIFNVEDTFRDPALENK